MVLSNMPSASFLFRHGLPLHNLAYLISPDFHTSTSKLSLLQRSEYSNLAIFSVIPYARTSSLYFDSRGFSNSCGSDGALTVHDRHTAMGNSEVIARLSMTYVLKTLHVYKAFHQFQSTLQIHLERRRRTGCEGRYTLIGSYNVSLLP